VLGIQQVRSLYRKVFLGESTASEGQAVLNHMLKELYHYDATDGDPIRSALSDYAKKLLKNIGIYDPKNCAESDRPEYVSAIAKVPFPVEGENAESI